MQFFPLLDREGQVRAWEDRKAGWISDLNGSVFAVTEFDGVFTAQANGEQIGWFCGDHLRDRLGRVVLARPGARIEGIIMPRRHKIPQVPPKVRVPIGRPLLKWSLPTAMKQRAWADFDALFDDGLAQVRAFEQELRRLANKPVGSSKNTFRKSTA